MRLTPLLSTWPSKARVSREPDGAPHGRRPPLTAQKERPKCRDHPVTVQSRRRCGGPDLRNREGRYTHDLILRDVARRARSAQLARGQASFRAMTSIWSPELTIG